MRYINTIKISFLLTTFILSAALINGAPLNNIQLAQSSVPLVAPTKSGATTNIKPADAEKNSEIATITIEGAQRVEPNTIISYLAFKVGDPWSPKLVDESIKSLFATDLFANVIITRNEDKKSVVVKVQENPSISRIAFEGNDRIETNILDAEVAIKPRTIYSKDKVRAAVQRILQIYQRKGRYAVIVEPKIIEQSENRIDLVFEITEGARSEVKKINFIGNKYFTDTELASKILTKEARWWRFLTSNDSYDADRLNVDKDELRRLYNNAGFADFTVLSAVAELEEDKSGFFINFTLSEGVRYKVDKTDITSQIPDLNLAQLKELITIEADDYYSTKKIDETIIAITDLLGKNGFAFVEIEPKLSKNLETKRLNIDFQIQNGKQVYVERINIKGNTRTVDKLIRRQLLIAEGDPYNSTKIRNSRQNVQDLGFFKSVKLENQQGSAPDRSQIGIVVEEQSTGDISLGVGFSTSDGALLQTGIRERNLLGEGRTLSLDLQAAQRRQNVNLGFTERYFMDKDLDAGFDIFSTRSNRQRISAYNSLDSGFILRTNFDYNDTTSQNYFYKLNNRKIYEIQPTASLAIKQQQGANLSSSVGQTISYDTRNSKIDPTDGYITSFNSDIAGLGGDVSFYRGNIRAAAYNNIFNDMVGVMGAEIGAMRGFSGRKVLVSDRFFLGGNNLRGFSDGGAGPVDSNGDALGGRNYATQSTEIRFPLGFFEEVGAKVSIFNDIGYLTSPEEKGATIRDSSKIRAAAGAGLSFKTPIGPMVFSLAKAYSKESYDHDQLFRFDFRSRF